MSEQNIFRAALLFGLYSPQINENLFHLMVCLWIICFGFGFGFGFNNLMFPFIFYIFFLCR